MYFFLSYARGKADDNKYVQQLHEDLCEEIGLFAGLRRVEDIGFHDGRIRIGMRWSDALVKALATCRVFLALCSPTYFTSEACGREWAIFLRRLEKQEAGSPGPADALMPLVWVPTVMPAVAARYQHTDESFGPVYAEHGVRDLARQRRFRDDYLRFVTALARRVIYLADNHPVPECLDTCDFETAESAFHQPSTPADHAHSPAGRVPTPPIAPDEPPADVVSSRRHPGRSSTTEDRPILSTYESDKEGRQDGADDPTGRHGA